MTTFAGSDYQQSAQEAVITQNTFFSSSIYASDPDTMGIFFDILFVPATNRNFRWVPA